MTEYIIAIDQGTTSTRAILVNKSGQIIAKRQKEFRQFFPQDGWVEHDPEEIWQTTLSVCKQVIADAGGAERIAAIGITNQRETSVIWERATAKCIYPAIVWQDRRTTADCHQLLQEYSEEKLIQKTGLLLDPYFSASKIKWLLENVSNSSKQAQQGKLAFGTIDSFLLWRLTGSKKHLTDATNAARTLLFNLTTQAWDEELLNLFRIPEQLLPEVYNNCAEFGVTEKQIFGREIPITALIGDQQAALVGQACFKPGMIKSTYGTGCFIVLNTGNEIVYSKHRLLTTIAYRLAGKVIYALEGSIFNAGTALQWLRDGLHLIDNYKDVENIAAGLADNGGVYFVPAFTGLGAPYWQPEARAAVFGLTRATQRDHLIRAALEAVCYQTCDLINAMQKDGIKELDSLRVDGGMTTNNWLMQYLADMLQLKVKRPQITETTALGAAYLAGLQIGFFESLEHITKLWQANAEFTPAMAMEKRQALYEIWQEKLERL